MSSLSGFNSPELWLSTQVNIKLWFEGSVTERYWPTPASLGQSLNCSKIAPITTNWEK